jgi:N4-gp56 family major capsid protein
MAQLWSVGTLGGYLYSNQLSNKLRVDVQPMCKFRQFADVKDPAGNVSPGKGETFTWDVVSDVGVQGRTLTETNTIPQTQFTITQGTLTVTEAGNSVPWTKKLELLAQIGPQKAVMTALRNDASKFFDILAWTEFNKTKLRVGGSTTTSITLSTGGTCTTTNSNALLKAHVKLISDTLKERNINPYEGDDYMCVGWPSTFRSFKNEMETLAAYTPEGLRSIRNGEFGRFESIRFIEQTFIPKGGAADTGATHDPYTQTADAWNGGYSDWAFFFGDDTVAEGIVQPEEVRAKVGSVDYGRDKGVAWYYLGGFGLVHTLLKNQRCIKWDSAV